MKILLNEKPSNTDRLEDRHQTPKSKLKDYNQTQKQTPDIKKKRIPTPTTHTCIAQGKDVQYPSTKARRETAQNIVNLLSNCPAGKQS